MNITTYVQIYDDVTVAVAVVLRASSDCAVGVIVVISELNIDGLAGSDMCATSAPVREPADDTRHTS